ncbi:uncharacterized protein LOC142351487 isoform X2 [Convolutriloba macropyga]
MEAQIRGNARQRTQQHLTARPGSVSTSLPKPTKEHLRNSVTGIQSKFTGDNLVRTLLITSFVSFVLINACSVPAARAANSNVAGYTWEPIGKRSYPMLPRINTAYGHNILSRESLPQDSRTPQQPDAVKSLKQSPTQKSISPFNTALLVNKLSSDYNRQISERSIKQPFIHSMGTDFDLNYA